MSPPNLLRFAEILPAEGRILLCTHRHPDPDGLGALVGLQQLLRERFNLESDLVLEGRIRRAENVAMRQLLEIHSIPKGGVNPADYQGLILVDSQPGFSHTHPPGGLPLLAVFDHHEGAEEPCSKHLDPGFSWVDSEFGATSTMVHHLMRAYEVEPNRRSATALFCGLRYDTHDLAQESTPSDEESYFELQRLADRKMLQQIDCPALPRAYFGQMAQAIDSCEVYGFALLALMGEVSSPESVAEVADWFVRLDGQQWSLAGGACDGRYQVSLRTDVPGADAYPALRYILGGDGACGGHGRMAGGQVPLNDVCLDEVIEKIRIRALKLFGVEGVEPVPLVEASERKILKRAQRKS
jgi:nanoRNase/pAp phosphatase (c-di-AMP/oligoRNAs hydrolase)